MRKILFLLLFIHFLLSKDIIASHLLAGEMTYKIIAPNQYEFTVYYYRDCRPSSQGGGNINALMEDEPLYITIFIGNTFLKVDSIQTVETQTLPIMNSNNCYLESQQPCINRIKFVFQENLPPSNNAYTILNQRCCMGNSIVNIINPSNLGNSLYCKIPPQNLGPNSSAIFSPLKNEVLCTNKKYTFDVSAFDPDGDLLSYEICEVDLGGNPNSPKPLITSGSLPSFTHPVYTGSFNAASPMPDISINSSNGELIINTNIQGSYLVGICCHEWRGGMIINTIRRTNTFIIQNCIFSGLNVKAYGDTVVPKGVAVHLNASGADNYHWDYAPKFSSNKIAFSDLQNPIVNQNFIGVFNFYVTGTSLEGCIGKDSLQLIFYNESKVFVPNAFSPNHDGLNDKVKILMTGYDLVYFKIYNRRGQEVFYTTDVNTKWDGSFKGEEMGMDTYHWVASAINSKDKIQIFKGDIVLIR